MSFKKTPMECQHPLSRLGAGQQIVFSGTPETFVCCADCGKLVAQGSGDTVLFLLTHVQRLSAEVAALKAAKDPAEIPDRGECPVCHRNVRLDNEGRSREHLENIQNGSRCTGSGFFYVGYVKSVGEGT